MKLLVIAILEGLVFDKLFHVINFIGKLILSSYSDNNVTLTENITYLVNGSHGNL